MYDAWFSGFNADFVTTTWVGFDQPDSLHEHGSQAALPMWIAFMREALAGKPEHTMAKPPGIVSTYINPYSGRWQALIKMARSMNIPRRNRTYRGRRWRF